MRHAGVGVINVSKRATLLLAPIEEEEPMPNYDLGILISIDIGLALVVAPQLTVVMSTISR